MYTIDLMTNNSGKGSPVFSARAKQLNTLFTAFNNALPEKVHSPDPPGLERKQIIA
jgi:hypothetical protein